MCETSTISKRPAEITTDIAVSKQYQDCHPHFVSKKRKIEHYGNTYMNCVLANSLDDIQSKRYCLIMDTIRQSSFHLPSFRQMLNDMICDCEKHRTSDQPEDPSSKVCGCITPIGTFTSSKKMDSISEISTTTVVSPEVTKVVNIEILKKDDDLITEKEENHAISKDDLMNTNTIGNDDFSDDDVEEDEYRARKILKKRTLTIEFWDRTEECRQAKWDHMEEMDAKHPSREKYILSTTLKDVEHVLEPNMFPYDTPPGIEHWVLWSRRELSHFEVEDCVYEWITTKLPHVECWNYDDNPKRSIDLFHVHVYLKVRDLPSSSPVKCKNLIA